MGLRLRTAVILTLTLTFPQYGYQDVGLVEFYALIYILWRPDTAVRIYIAVFCVVVQVAMVTSVISIPAGPNRTTAPQTTRTRVVSPSTGTQ